MPWDAPGPVLAATGNVWPGVSMPGSGDSAGPTSVPWLDSNGWFVQMARARTQKPLWLMFDPPGKGRILTAANYQTAICDAEITGGRWAISLDETLRAGLAEGNAAARETFSRIGATIAFFGQHAGVADLSPAGRFRRGLGLHRRQLRYERRDPEPGRAAQSAVPRDLEIAGHRTALHRIEGHRLRRSRRRPKLRCAVS